MITLPNPKFTLEIAEKVWNIISVLELSTSKANFIKRQIERVPFQTLLGNGILLWREHGHVFVTVDGELQSTINRQLRALLSGLEKCDCNVCLNH